MKIRIKFNLVYFLISIAIFVVEVCIALYSHDNIVRPYIGDFLVVILIYCFAKSFLDMKVLPTAIAVLIFAYIVEILQYFKLVKLLGLQHSKLARIIIGSSFEWIDLIMYSCGILLVLLTERLLSKVDQQQSNNKTI